MARSKKKELLAQARAHTHPFYYEGLWPPAFLIEEEGKRFSGNWQARQQAALQATWEEYRVLLGETPAQQRTGYPALVALECSLDERIASLDDEVNQAKAYARYFERAFRIMQEEARRYGPETLLGGALPADIPLGSEVWERGWETSLIGSSRSEGAAESVKEDEEVAGLFSFEVREPVRSLSKRSSSGGLPPGDDFSFEGDQTFREVLGQVRQRYQLAERTYRRWRDTKQLLAFRLAVVRNVRWQFDLYGSVTSLTPEIVRQMLQPVPTGRGRVIDYERLTALLSELASKPALRHASGKRAGMMNVSAVLRAIEQRSDVLKHVSDRQARKVITQILEQKGLR